MPDKPEPCAPSSTFHMICWQTALLMAAPFGLMTMQRLGEAMAVILFPYDETLIQIWRWATVATCVAGWIYFKIAWYVACHPDPQLAEYRTPEWPPPNAAPQPVGGREDAEQIIAAEADHGEGGL